MAHTIKLGLLGNNLGRSRAKNLDELLGELHGLNVTYQPMDYFSKIALFIPTCSAFVNGNREYIVMEAL